MRLASKISSRSGSDFEFEILCGSDENKSNLATDMVWERDALGRLRRELVWTIGEDRMHSMMSRLGFSSGQSDWIKKGMTNPSIPKNLGNLKGLGSTVDQYEFIYEVTNSCEALEHTRFFQPPIELPQCWLLAGYLTGFISAKLNKSIYFFEVQCVARQDSCCRFIGKERETWGQDQRRNFRMYQEDNLRMELEETKEQLKLTKDRYQNLFEQSSVPIFIIDPETGRHLDGNLSAEELTGYSHEELLARNMFDLRPTEEHSTIAHNLKILSSDESIKNQEMVLLKKDGTHLIVSQSSKILFLGGQKVIQTIMRDITDLKESEQKERDLHKQLLRSERLSGIGRLAASVAHELKNPLGAIRNAIYYIREALRGSQIVESDPQLKNIIQLVEDEVDGSVKIIGELLDFSRVIEILPRPTQINDLLEKVSSSITIPENIEVKFDLDMTLPSANVDQDRIKQVFINVINNAVQSMEKGGTLIVKTRLEIQGTGQKGAKGELVTVSFEDTGTGIDSLHLKKIFEPLFTTKARGTGLGLAISNNIIQKHGGVIHVTSKKGRGTCFTIQLPLNPPKSKEEMES
ncbi:hypothetical protein BVX98_07965 [bacterium F11]|nr:hypothetical protein BVX98_07965 [bacterium F11]